MGVITSNFLKLPLNIVLKCVDDGEVTFLGYCLSKEEENTKKEGKYKGK